jgi:hypothetical protein
MTTLTTETQARLNAEIAKMCGVKITGIENGICYTNNPYNENRGGLQAAFKPVHNYFSNDLPIKHRLEMLGCLTRAEKLRIFNLVGGGRFDNYGDEIITILELDQPTLALKVCEIKGWV